ncbi:MAG: AzlC family ABC transporter permease [Pseudolabrys sp.]|nr:AzlC family ABC transporter permease [Pseudolabrys sp.]
MAGLKEFSNQPAAFRAGARSAWTSVFALVLAGTYVGLGALAHDFGFSPWWLAASTIVVWAAPAQVILLSTLANGSTLIEAAIAVTLSAIRLFPMVVALLPLLRGATKNRRALWLPTHFTAISMWVESLRLLPGIALPFRIAFCNGLGLAYMAVAFAFGFVGFYLAAGLPVLLAAALLFLTPMSFITSTARNSRAVSDKVAFVAGIVLGPLLAWYQVGLDLMWTGIMGGALAYGAHRLRRVAMETAP